MTQSKRSKAKPRRVWIPIVLLVAILAGAGYGYYSWNRAKAVSAQSPTPSFNTTQVRRGSISLTASGTGTLAPGAQNDLSFFVSSGSSATPSGASSASGSSTNGSGSSTSGSTANAAGANAGNTTTSGSGSSSGSSSASGSSSTSGNSVVSSNSNGAVIAKVAVQPGDQVKQGQVLAQLGGLDSLQSNVVAAQQDLISAQQALDTLKQSATANIANAQLAISNDQKALDTAKSGLIKPGMQRCDQQTTDAYYAQWDQAKNYLTSLGDGGGNTTYYTQQILPAKNKVAQAYATYQWCLGFTDYELNASQAKLTLAQTQLQTDQNNLANLQKNSGLDPTTLAQAQNKVDNAQSALDQAKAALDGATIKAPYDGTILAVNGQVGDVAPSGAFITIADLAHPQVQFSVDETDLDKVAMGEQASVVFDAMPNQTFTGKVIRVNPSLVTSGNVQVVQGIIQLDMSKVKNPPTLLQGLNATITLVKAQADNVLILPQQAVRDLGDGTYGVFIIGPDGQPALKTVEIGLQDAANVEIKSGLTAGQTVSTGTAQTRPNTNSTTGGN